MLNISNVGIHNLSPGMVTTDLLMTGAWSPALHISAPTPAQILLSCISWGS